MPLLHNSLRFILLAFMDYLHSAQAHFHSLYDAHDIPALTKYERKPTKGKEISRLLMLSQRSCQHSNEEARD